MHADWDSLDKKQQKIRMGHWDYGICALGHWDLVKSWAGKWDLFPFATRNEERNMMSWHGDSRTHLNIVNISSKVQNRL